MGVAHGTIEQNNRNCRRNFKKKNLSPKNKKEFDQFQALKMLLVFFAMGVGMCVKELPSSTENVRGVT